MSLTTHRIIHLKDLLFSSVLSFYSFVLSFYYFLCVEWDGGVVCNREIPLS